MPVPDFADPRPPYVQIAADLRKQIREGRYAPGDKLPSHSVLRETYNSAVETVRRALATLRDEGLVETHSTRGTFVLRVEADPEPSPEFTRLKTELSEAEDRLARRIDGLTRHIDGEIAKLRDELEYVQAQIMALEGQPGAARGEDVG